MKRFNLIITSIHIYFIYLVVSWLVAPYTGMGQYADAMAKVRSQPWVFGLDVLAGDILQAIYTGTAKDDRVLWVVYGETREQLDNSIREADEYKWAGYFEERAARASTPKTASTRILRSYPPPHSLEWMSSKQRRSAKRARAHKA